MTSMITRARQWLSRTVAPASHHTRRFQAARMDRLTADWMATAQSINEELRSDLDALRSRGRQLGSNNDYAKKFVGMVKDNIIGPGGVRLQVRIEDSPGKPDRLASAAIERAYNEWQAVADVTGHQHFRDMCETMVGGLPSDGEFLLRMVRGADSGNRFNFGLQLIDVDRIDTTYNGRHGANTVIMGVEVNAYRRPVAVHIFAAHPNDGQHSSRQRIRLPLDDVIHGFKVERSEQLRGIPWMAAGMLSLHHLGNFKLAALLAAEHGANHYGFFTTPDGQSPIGAPDSTGGEAVTVSQPGYYDTLPTGVQFTPYDSKYPEQNFGPFVKTTLQRIASGWGWPTTPWPMTWRGSASPASAAARSKSATGGWATSNGSSTWRWSASTAPGCRCPSCRAPSPCPTAARCPRPSSKSSAATNGSPAAGNGWTRKPTPTPTSSRCAPAS